MGSLSWVRDDQLLAEVHRRGFPTWGLQAQPYNTNETSDGFEWAPGMPAIRCYLCARNNVDRAVRPGLALCDEHFSRATEAILRPANIAGP